MKTKRKRWKYRVFVGDQLIKTFSSRKTAREFMENMTEMDLPFLVMPWENNTQVTMIGELK
jgi:hypothetical protein